MRYLLAIETTCDETAAAVIGEDFSVRGQALASQAGLHQRYGGVVPEEASRAHVEALLPIVDQALAQAGIEPASLTAVTVAHTPGLAGSLLVGVAGAKALALAWQKPLVGINHIHAHIYACRMAAARDVFPCVGLVASGGHTNLFACESPLDFRSLGSTIDDAAGEAFDKVAQLLGLDYPGGPSIKRTARDGDPAAFAFPRALLSDTNRLDFSFSGLKTAVRYQIFPPGKPANVGPVNRSQSFGDDVHDGGLPAQRIADLAASFQAAVVDVLVGKSEQALRHTGYRTLCVGGGVAANSLLRERLAELSQRRNIEVHIAPRQLCTDNAVMGAIAWERLRAGLIEALDLDALPGMVRHARETRV